MKNTIFLFIIIAFAACTGGKKTAQNTSKLKKRSVAEVLTELNKNTVDYTWYSAKGRVGFNADGITQNADIKLRMRRDSAIWIAVSVIGIEGGRALITPDSIKLINRMNSTYLVEPFSYFQKKYNIPLSFQSLQEMLIGNAPDRKDIGWRGDRDSTQYILTKTMDAEQMLYRVNGTTFLLENLEISNLRMQQYMKISNANFETIGTRKLPTVRAIQIKSTDLAQPLLMGMDFSKVELPETAPNMQLEIPLSYTRTKE